MKYQALCKEIAPYSLHVSVYTLVYNRSYIMVPYPC